MNKEFIEKAEEVGSVEELLSLAKENNTELFNSLHVSGELSDDELKDVAGGSAALSPSYNYSKKPKTVDC